MTKTAMLYGGSLYELAASENLTESIMEEMTSLKSIFDENPDYLRLLSEPAIAKKERIDLLDKAFSDSVNVYLLNFMKILCENGTIREFSDCLHVFRDRYNEANNITEAIVTSAIPLTGAQQAALKAKLESYTNKNILLTTKVNPAVLGGIKVSVDGKELDGTALGRLSSLRKKLTETIV